MDDLSAIESDLPVSLEEDSALLFLIVSSGVNHEVSSISCRSFLVEDLSCLDISQRFLTAWLVLNAFFRGSSWTTLERHDLKGIGIG